ncbi:MAG: hypothetical protein JST22_07580 [Bacteroidetes bacterium]|nr:hypothetical protein [Bacteroidota bacterium]
MSNPTLYFSPQFRASSFGISGAPALAAYNNLLYMAWRGAGSGDDEIYYAAFNGNGTAWSAQNRAGGFGISDSPALAVYNGLLYMAWRGAGSGDDEIYYAAFNGSSWSGQNRAGGFGISGSPTLAVYNGLLYMAWRGAGSGDDEIYYAAFNGSSWSGQNRAGSFGISGSPALCAFNGLLYMAWRGAGSGDDKIYYAAFNGSSWSGQNRAGNFGISGSPALCAFSDRLYMTWRGAGNGDEKFYYAAFNDSSWSEQEQASNFGTSDNAAMAVYGPSLSMAWRGAGSGDDKIYCSFTYTQGITNWMHESYNLLKNYSLKQICVPGAHDAAMYVQQNCTTGADSCNTQTQYKTMLGMLEAGVRYFDMRPVLDENSTMYCGHFTDAPVVGISGCDGDLLENMLDGVLQFMKAGAKELVILKFSHYLDQSNDSFGFSESQMNTLIEQVTDTLGSWLFVNNTGKRLADIPFSTLIGSTGTVFAVFDELPSACRTSGIYSYADLDPDNPNLNADLVVYDVYAHTDTLDDMISDQFEKLENTANHAGDLFLLSWTLTLTGSEAFWGTECISDLAVQANNALIPNMTAWYDQGSITETLIPNIIYVDFADGWAAATCVQLNQALLAGVPA